MMRLCFLLILYLPHVVLCQDPSSLFKEAQQQEAALHENEAFLKYAAILKLQPSHLAALCKCSELCCRIGARQPDKAKKADYFRAAKTYASAALRVNPNSSEANFVMAFSLGRLSIMSSGKEKIALVNDIRHYAEKSILEDPLNFKPYHVLGKWNYEVSNLNLAERSLARLLYGGLPPASLKDAINNYEKSKAINPAFILNYLELARCFHRIDDDKKAIASINAMLKIPDGMLDDKRIKDEARQMLKDWK